MIQIPLKAAQHFAGVSVYWVKQISQVFQQGCVKVLRKSQRQLSSVKCNHCSTWAPWRLGNDLVNHISVLGEVYTDNWMEGMYNRVKFQILSERHKICCGSGFLCLTQDYCVLVILQVSWMWRWEGKEETRGRRGRGRKEWNNYLSFARFHGYMIAFSYSSRLL